MSLALNAGQLQDAVRVALGAAPATSGTATQPIEPLLANRLGPLIVRGLRRSDPAASIPPELVEDARAAATRALAALGAVRAIADALDTGAIRWLLWKGPALAAVAWGDPTARHFSDLDLVVAPEDLDRADAALVAAGWRRRLGMTRAQQRAILGGRGALDFERSADEPFVELHWRFLGARFPAVLRPATVIARSRLVELGGVQVRTPNAADTLLLQAVHAAKHGWSHAEEVATFARLVALAPEEMAALVARGPRASGAKAIAIAAGLLEWFRTANGRSSPADPVVAACVDRMCRGDAGWRPGHAWSAVWADRPAERLRYWPRALLGPTLEEWKWVRLPDPLAWLYPAVRLARLVTRAR